TGDVGVTRGGAGWNLSQCLPDTLLKGRAPNIERQVESQGRRLHKADHFRDELLELGVGARQSGAWELVLQIVRHRFGVVAQENGANAPLAPGNQNRSQRTLTDSETYFRARAAGAII